PPARAGDAGGDDPTSSKPDSQGIRLPVLIDGPPAAYPPAALAAGLEAAVLLELDIDETGAVVAGRVVSPAVPLDPEVPPSRVADQGFEEAALEAARRFVFEPARDADGQAVPARIQYRYRFTVATAPPVVAQEPDASEPPPPAAPPPTSGGREPGEEEPGEVFEVVGDRARPETTERC
ncbi:MAG: TonB family protein, partial [Deltaproteobacteria bacterium]